MSEYSDGLHIHFYKQFLDEEAIVPQKDLAIIGFDGYETFVVDKNIIGIRPKWINLKDEMPKINGKYLSWDGVDVKFEYFEDGHFLMMMFPSIRYCQERIPFTHWMPLPKPPE